MQNAQCTMYLRHSLLLYAITDGNGIPVVAIGGIDGSNIAKLKGCGMAGFAVSSGIFGSEDVENAAKELQEAAHHVL